MRHEYADARRHAENTIAEANRHLNSGKIKNPRHHQMLTTMIKDATDTLKNLDARDDARPYSDTNIGYNADMRRRRYENTNNVDDLIDTIDKILPHITNGIDFEMRQGVPGTGPYANPRLRRRGGRKGIGRRRADLDDRYDIDDDDMRAEDMRYDNTRSRSDNDRHVHDAVARVAATAAADAAIATARRMTNDTNDTHTIYPTTPVMPRYDETRNDMRHNEVDDRTNRSAGPDMRR